MERSRSRFAGRLAVAVCVAAVALFGLLGRPGPAGARGLDVMCTSADLIPVAPDQAPRAFGGLGATFRGTPAGAAAPQVDRQYAPGQLRNLNADLNGDGSTDADFGYTLLIGSQPPPDELTGGRVDLGSVGFLRDVLGVAPDSPAGDHWAVGVNTYFQLRDPGAAAVRNTPYKAEMGIYLDFTRRDGSVETTHVRVVVDALGAGARLPDRLDLSLLYKIRNAVDPPEQYVVAGLRTRFNGLAAGAAPPPLKVSLVVESVAHHQEAGRTVVDASTPVASFGLGFSATPLLFDLGVKHVCPQNRPDLPAATQIAAVVPAAGAGQPANMPAGGTDLDLDVASGLGTGYHGADELRLRGRIARLPSHLDVVMRPDRIDVVHSGDTSPTLRVDDLTAASVDGAEDWADLPLHAEGVISGLPPHLQVRATTDPTDEIVSADVRFCPALDPVVVDPLPPADVRIDGNALLAACRARPVAANARLLVQNFAPGDVASGALAAGLPVLPAAGRSLLYGSREVVAAAAGRDAVDLYRFGGDLDGLRRVLYETTGAPAGGSRLHLRAETDRDNADTQVRVATDTRTSPDEIANAGAFLSVNAEARPLRTTTEVDFVESAAAPVDVRYKAAAATNLRGTAHLQRPGPTATTADTAFDFGRDGAGGLAAEASLRYLPGAPGAESTVEYRASSPTRVFGGILMSDRADRLVGMATHIFTDTVVPGGIDAARPEPDRLAPLSARWRRVGGRLVSGSVDVCADRGGCDLADLDVAVETGQIGALAGGPAQAPQFPNNRFVRPAGFHALFAGEEPHQDMGRLRSLVRISGRLPRVVRAVYDTANPPAGGERVGISIESGGTFGAQVRVAVDGRDRPDSDGLNTGSDAAVDVSVAPFPARLALDVASGPGVPLQASWNASAAAAVNGTVRMQSPGRRPGGAAGSLPATVCDGVVELGGGGADGLAVSGSVLYTEAAAGGGTDHHVTYTAAAPTRVRLGAFVSSLAQRTLNERSRVRADVVVPNRVDAAWRIVGDDAVWATADLCAAAGGCDLDADIWFERGAVPNPAGGLLAAPAAPTPQFGLPAGAGPFVLYASQARYQGSAREYLRFAARLPRVRHLGFAQSEVTDFDDVVRTNVRLDATTAAPGGATTVKVSADGRTTRADDRVNTASWLWGEATVTPWPATLALGISTETENYNLIDALGRGTPFSPLEVDYRASQVVTVRGRAHAHLRGRDPNPVVAEFAREAADVIDATFDVGVDGLAGLADRATLTWSKVEDRWGEDFGTYTTARYQASRATRVRLGLVTNTDADRRDLVRPSKRARVWSDVTVPDDVQAGWRSANGAVRSATVTLCGAAGGCDVSADVVVTGGRPAVADGDLLVMPAPANGAADLVTPPAAPARHVLFVTKSARPVDATYTRFSLRLPRVRSLSYSTGEFPWRTTRIDMASETAVAADAQVLVAADSRRAGLLPENQPGSWVRGRATLTPWPAKLGLGYAATEASPLSVTTTASDRLAVAGTVEARLPGFDEAAHKALDATELAANVRVGGGAADGLARSTRVYLNRMRLATGRFSHLRYEGSEQVHVVAGAVVQDRNDRAARVRDRLQFDAVLPKTLSATWTDRWTFGAGGQVAGSEIVDASAEACDAANRAACTNQTTVVIEHGPAQTGENLLATLLNPPTLPSLPNDPATGRPVHPAFTARGANDGLAYVKTDDAKRWGLSAKLTNLAQVRYVAAPQTFCVQTNPVSRTFVANVYSPAAFGSRSGSVYADATIRRFPANLGGRVLENGTPGDEQPWLWLTTDDCDARRSPDLAPRVLNEAPASSVDAVVRAGDTESLKRLGIPGRPARANGIDANADVADGTAAVHGRVVAPLPKHLLVWRPGLSDACDDSTPVRARVDCQWLPHYEPDERQQYRLRYRSTSAALGNLVTGLVYRSGGDRFRVDGRVMTLPGTLDGTLDVRKNRRLPWTDVALRYRASAPLGTVTATLDEIEVDGRPKDTYRGAGVAPVAQNAVPEWRAELTNVAASLDVNARLRFSEDAIQRRLWKNACSGYTYAGEGSTPTYVDARLDLAGATTVSLDAYDEPGGPTQARLQADRRISGTLTTKLPNNHAHEITRDVFLYLGWDAVNWTSDVDLCSDFDLPLTLVLRNVSETTLGMHGLKLNALVRNEERDAGGRVQVRIGETFFDPGAGREVTRDGAWFHHHFIHFDPAYRGDWQEGPVDDTWRDVFVVPLHVECSDHPCYATRDVANLVDTDNDRNGWESTFLLDPFWGQADRASMWDRDENWCEWVWYPPFCIPLPGRPGGEFYSALADGFREPGQFLMPDLAAVPELGIFLPRRGTPAVPLIGIEPAAGEFDTGTVNPLCLPEWDTMADDPVAVATDGTEYRIEVVDRCLLAGRPQPDQPQQAQHHTDVRLVAEYRFAGRRWNRPVFEFGDPAPPMVPGGLSRITAVPFGFRGTIVPAEDGSVALDMAERGYDAWEEEWEDTGLVRHGTLDASGFGLLAEEQSGGRHCHVPGGAAPAGAEVRMANCSGVNPPEDHRVWHLGDGTVTEGPADRNVGFRHAYPMPGPYYVRALDYDAGAEPTRHDVDGSVEIRVP